MHIKISGRFLSFIINSNVLDNYKCCFAQFEITSLQIDFSCTIYQGKIHRLLVNFMKSCKTQKPMLWAARSCIHKLIVSAI